MKTMSVVAMDFAANYTDASKTPDASTFMREAVVEGVALADVSGHHHVARKAGARFRG